MWKRLWGEKPEKRGRGEKMSVVETSLGLQRDGIHAIIALQAARKSPGVCHQEDLAGN